MSETKLYSMVPLLRTAELSSLRGKQAAIGAFNVNFYAQAEGILRGLMEAESPGIIQASKGANKFQGGPDKIQMMTLNAMKDLKCGLMVALHLDHGDVDSAKKCVDSGFSSVMIDASHKPEKENMDSTREVVEYAAPKGASVEGEYGLLAGVEEDIIHAKSVYADPKFVPVFLDRSGADALAIAYGTSHGPTKGRTDALNVAIVRQSYQGLKANGMNLDKFLVGHGSSTVPKELVDEINSLGGKLKNTSGVPEYKIKEAIEGGIRKVNIDTDLRLGITAVFRKYFADHPGVEKKSDALSLIKDVFDGKTPAKDKDGKPVDSGTLVDPRSYLDPLMVPSNNMAQMLREDYRTLKDEAFIEVMGLVSDRIKNHVLMLTKLFGSYKLASQLG